jgi:hypothetical protein
MYTETTDFKKASDVAYLLKEREEGSVVAISGEVQTESKAMNLGVSLRCLRRKISWPSSKSPSMGDLTTLPQFSPTKDETPVVFHTFEIDNRGTC